MQPCGSNYPRIEGQGAKKEDCFVRIILDFQKNKFQLFVLLMVVHNVIFNVTT
jgi:hypothetical protein